MQNSSYSLFVYGIKKKERKTSFRYFQCDSLSVKDEILKKVEVLLYMIYTNKAK